jgi:hypothetical protein
VYSRPLPWLRRCFAEQAEARFVGLGTARLRRVCQRVANELPLAVPVTTVLLGRCALTLALVDDEVGQQTT